MEILSLTSIKTREEPSTFTISTFILLTSFAASPAAVGKVLGKSLSGYVLAFFLGLVVFSLIAKLAKKHFTGEAKFGWTIAQWITTGTLWSVWLMQDAANIAVYLPRSMSFSTFFGRLNTVKPNDFWA